MFWLSTARGVLGKMQQGKVAIMWGLEKMAPCKGTRCSGRLGTPFSSPQDKEDFLIPPHEWRGFPKVAVL
jgi:hypothetical protein